MKKYKKIIAEEVSSILSVEADEIVSLLEYPPGKEMGDLSLPCFKLSKKLRQSPQAIAEKLKNAIRAEPFERVDSVSGYLNFHIRQMTFADGTLREILAQGDRYGSGRMGAGQTVVIDFSSPNVAKPFHVAHLRSTVIGNALYRIHSFLGFDCVGINHLGDWGTQFGKLIVAYKSWGNPRDVEDGGIDELLRLYVKFHEEAERDPTLEDEARACFADMEKGDSEILGLWRRFVDISVKEFQRIYGLLGVRFDSFAGESFYNDKMAGVVVQLKRKDLLVEDEGAWLVHLEDYGMPPALILKKDGSSLYAARDIAAALYRKETYDFDKAIYVTDYAQNLHFQQWFKVVDLMGYEWAKDLLHVAFGRVSLEGMSLSTRKGNIVKLEEVLMQAVAKTKDIMVVRIASGEELDETARMVGVGAVIFHDLSSNRIRDIVFSWDDVLNFEGETGPYVQYTHARACKVLSKAAFEFGDSVDSNDFYERLRFPPEFFGVPAFELLKVLSSFGEIVESAMQKLEPSIVSRYLLDLAQSFNRFYHDSKILVDDAPLRTARLAAAKCTAITLKNGLGLIGLEAPERM